MNTEKDVILAENLYLGYTYADLHIREGLHNIETYQSMLYCIKGTTFFHENALDVDKLTLALLALEDDKPLMISQNMK